MTTLDEALNLAASHGLCLSAKEATVNEAGLDYQVVMAPDETGQEWVLRIPRREDVARDMAAELAILELVSPILGLDGIEVPDWRIRSPELIAYPALPGAPGLTLSEAGEPIWHMDPASPDYAARLGRLLGRLHSVTAAEAATAGVEIRSPDEVRQAWRDDVARVSAEFTVAPALAGAWQTWLEHEVESGRVVYR